MDVLLMILPVFLVCVKAENLTTVEVQLGQNVTLNCSANLKNIFWYMELHSHFLGCIVHIFNSGSEKQFYVSTSVTKYVVVEANRLMLTNVTTNDCRRYFCAKGIRTNVDIIQGFTVHSDVPASPNNQIPTNQSQQMRTKWPDSVIYSSLALNVLLFMVMGGVFTYCCLKRKILNRRKDRSGSACESPAIPEAPQYEEIELPFQTAVLPANPPAECIYYKAQLPQPMPRRLPKIQAMCPHEGQDGTRNLGNN